MARLLIPSLLVTVLALGLPIQAVVAPMGGGAYQVWDIGVKESSLVTLGVEVEFTGGSTQGHGFWLYDGNGTLVRWLVGRGSTGATQVSVAAGGMDPVSACASLSTQCQVDPLGRCGPSNVIHWATRLEPGDSRILGMYAVDGPWEGGLMHEWPDEVVLLQATEGPAKLLTDRDFAGTRAYASSEAGVSTKVAGPGRHHAEVGNRLFGFYWGSTNTGMLDMRVAQPDGSVLEGRRFYTIADAQPGGYDFHLEQVDVGGPFLDPIQVHLLLADVALPP